MRILALNFFLLTCITGMGQVFDTTKYTIRVESSLATNQFFENNSIWRGADGASSVDLGDGKILWLFSDTFICTDSSKTRSKATIVRNSIAIQQGHDLKTASVKFYWDKSTGKPAAFFHTTGQGWLWLGHGIMIKDKLLIFLMKEHGVTTGFGFETFGWSAVLVSNPEEEPTKWKMMYIEGPGTYGTIAGSAAVLKDQEFIYAYGAVEPGTHEVYLLRWKLKAAYVGNLSQPQWWLNGRWSERKSKNPIPAPLFTGATEYSVNYDSSLKKYIQVQAVGFGEAKIGLRLADKIQGPWTAPYLFYTPPYQGIKRPFMYSAKAHPELNGSGTYITYNINSFDFEELLKNDAIYFPKFISIKIVPKKNSD